MTRDEGIRLLKLALLRGELDREQRDQNLEALQQLLQDLEAAEELLDEFYEDLVERAGDRKPRLDQIVFSRRVMKGE